MPLHTFLSESFLSEEDYTYVRNLTNTGKSELFDESSYHFICFASVMSLYVLSCSRSKGSSSFGQPFYWKNRYDLFVYEKPWIQEYLSKIQKEVDHMSDPKKIVNNYDAPS